jgi:hypothetical protein
MTVFYTMGTARVTRASRGAKLRCERPLGRAPLPRSCTMPVSKMVFYRSALLFVIAISGLVSCGSDVKPAAKTAGRCAEMGAKVGVAGAKTGVLTGVEGVKTAGKAVGGFVEGGSDGAEREWKQGKAETKRTAHEGADEVRHESKDCP